MDTATMDNLKEQLMKDNPTFRQLAQEHKKYETRLTELTSLAHPNEDEQMEETVLKKKKLAIKDQMYEMLTNRGESAIQH